MCRGFSSLWGPRFAAEGRRVLSSRFAFVLALLAGSSGSIVPVGAQVLPDCPLPAPGPQTSMSRASIDVIFPQGVTETVQLSGESTIVEEAPGREGIPIEILAMDLTGTMSLGPVRLRESPTLPSRGLATNVQCLPGTDGALEPHVDSFFDVFVEVEVQGLTLHNGTPIRMQSRKPVPLDHRLPGVVLFQAVGAAPIDLLGPNNQPTGIRITNTRHELVPPTPSCFPPAGKDVMDSVLLHDIDIPGIGLCQANLSGPVTVQRSDPYVDPATGLQCIDTEIIDMTLQGVDPICGRMIITLNPFRKSTGRICEKFPGTCFPANSFFDVFIKVELPDLGFCLYACQSAHMECMIDAIPPFRCLYNLNIGAGAVVPLYRGPCNAAGADPCAVQPLPQPAAFIVKAVHQPLPPQVCDCFPRAGEDVLVTTLIHQIDIPGLQISCSQFTGPIVIRRGDPYINDQGLCCIKTEVVKLEMIGTCNNGATATIRLCPNRRSTGFICAKERGKCFPATSCFDIYFEIEVRLPTGGTVKLKNCRAATMCCMIDALPPLGCPYALQNGPIELYRVAADGSIPCNQSPLPNPDGFLREASHIPNEPGKPCCPEYGPGRDVLQSQLQTGIDIPGIGRCVTTLLGPIVVERGTPYQDPATGLCCVETRLVDMNLQGSDPICGRICITLDPRRPSKGTICSKERGACFPATSCFDVYVRIQLKDKNITLVNCKLARMCCMIDAVPPYGCNFKLELGPGEVVSLYNEVTARAAAGAGGGVATPCTLPDNGTGTVNLPPEGCGYVSPDQVHMIIDGLPAGTTINIGVEHERFFNITRAPGGTLGGEVEQFSSSLTLALQGTGVLAGFSRNLLLPAVQCESHVGPRTPGDPVQSFDTDMFRIQGQLPPGDPDFDLLRITAGTGFGLPSPGHTTLTRQPGGSWAVDSFFDITYRIDFVGRPGGPLGGRSGSTTGTIRMATGGGGGGVPQDPCEQAPLPNPQAILDTAVLIPNPPCTCYPPAGDDTMQSELSHRVRVFGLGPGGADIVCDANMAGPMTVRRSAARVDPFTGLCCIDTEIISMELRGNDPICGEVILRESPTRRSAGQICEKSPGTCFPANSFFDVFIDVEIPSLGLRLSNCGPTRMECMIDAIPPLNCVYQLNLSSVPLYKPDECPRLPNPNIRPTGVIETALHVPREPCTCDYGPGIDTMDSTLSHDIVIFGLGGDKLCGVPMRGVVEVERGIPYKTSAGLCCVTTRMRKLDLTGVDPTCGPVRIRLCPDKPSTGTICQMMAGACFPATSCFDVFIEVEVMGMVMKNCQPAQMCCKIERLPPFRCVYQLNLGAALPLYTKGDCGPNATPIGEIRNAQHVPTPCGPLGIRCERQADGTVRIGVVDSPNCPCEGRTVITRSVDGGPPVIVANAPAGGLVVDPCEGLPAGPHVIKYCAKCVLADGTESDEVCCSIDVVCEPPPPGDCIRQGSVNCKVVDGKVVLDWTYVDPNCRCEKVEISLNGAVIGTVGGDVTSFTTETCEPGRYCVQCVTPDGRRGALHCCTLPECPTTCPADCIGQVFCDVQNGRVIVRWTTRPDCVCERTVVTLVQSDGTSVVVATLDPTQPPSVTLACKPGRYCVSCVCADGTFSLPKCCEVTAEQCGGGDTPFIRCDSNCDGTDDISDDIYTLTALFLDATKRPCCDAVADCNDDGSVDIADPISHLNFKFLGSRAPPAPYPLCGATGCPDYPCPAGAAGQ